jgi:DNA-binding beta-propeller fold protein YncE
VERPSYGGTLGLGSLWVSDFDFDEVRRYDPADGTLAATIEVASPAGLIVADGALWVAGHRDGTVRRFDPATNQVVAAVRVGRDGPSGPHELAIAEGRVWVGIPNEGTVVSIDPGTNAVAGRVSVDAPAAPCGGISSYGGLLFISSCANSGPSRSSTLRR